MKEKLKALWNRYVNRETVTYVIFGVLTTLVNYIIYYGLRALDHCRDRRRPFRFRYQ